jgi:ABC-type antimicrobial peptide transport system permease subunit
MLLFFEHLGDAIRSLRSTRTRTILTTLGVAIGVASITTILALSGGMMNVISRQVASLEGNIILVRPGSPSENSPLDFTTPLNRQLFSTSTLSTEDVSSITKIDGVEEVAPIMTIGGTLKANESSLSDGTIVATTPELASIANLGIRDGQFIDSVTNPNTAVIGSQVAFRLFGSEQAIGQTFTVRGQLFTVIGVLKRMNDPINFNAIDFDMAVIINMKAGESLHDGKGQIQQINIRAKSPGAVGEVEKLVESTLKERRKGEQDFSLISGDAIARPTNQLFIAVAGVMTAIATISLVVGGIGIMNIMLVNVAERTREIGLRKAIGASNRNILGQFLTESLVVSLAGGIAGYGLGYFTAFMVSRFLNFTPVFTWQIAATALGISVAVGVLFGFYPAIRAARKDPIESLRQYH